MRRPKLDRPALHHQRLFLLTAMRRFPWRYVMILALAAGLLVMAYKHRASLSVWLSAEWDVLRRGTLVTARIGGEKITLLECEEAMRDHLWRTGGNWSAMSPEQRKQTRESIVEKLVNDRLIRLARVKAGALDGAAAADGELAMFAKQFEHRSELEARLALRRIHEPELARRMRDAIDDEAWLESQIAARVNVAVEKDLSDRTGRNAPSMQMPPVFAVAHLYLTSHDPKHPDRRGEIQDIHRRLMAGEATFEQLALLHSDDERSKKAGGVLGWCARGRMPEDFMAVVEKLGKGETSAPVETKLGWHVIRLLDKKPGRAAAMDEVENEMKVQLSVETRGSALRDLLEELRKRPDMQVVLNQDVIDSAGPPS